MPKPWGLAVAVALGCAVGNACLVDLESIKACGDGFTDASVGEECDPNDEASYFGACPNPDGRAACDPETCEIIATEEQCAYCGDGVITPEAGEECDGSNIGVPCWGAGSPTCTLDCKIDFDTCAPCGNGILEGKEECDDGIAGGSGDDIAISIFCAGTLDTPPLPPPYQDLPYTAGSTNTCTNCRYDRRECNYCGNGIRNDATLNSPHDSQSLTRRELCDGDDFDDALLAEQFPLCEDAGVRGNVQCNDDCLGWTQREGEPLCCVPKGSACPAEGSGIHCCYFYSHPDAESECLPVILPTEGQGTGKGNANVCR